MTAVVYAYEPEVRVLKELVKESSWQDKISWYKWPTFPDNADLILNVGFAGCLNPNLALGQVVLVDKILADSKEPIFLNDSQAENFCKSHNLSLTTLLTAQNPVTSILDRDELRQKTGADIVDMEGHHLYSLAKKNNMPLISLKVISDNADSDVWQTIKQNSERWSEILGKTAFELLKML